MSQDQCEIASGKPSEAQAVDRSLEPIVGRASSPVVGDRFVRPACVVTVTGVRSDGFVMWTYSGPMGEADNITCAKDWKRLARNTIEHGAEFIPANPEGLRTRHLVEGTLPPVVGGKDRE